MALRIGLMMTPSTAMRSPPRSPPRSPATTSTTGVKFYTILLHSDDVFALARARQRLEIARAGPVQPASDSGTSSAISAPWWSSTEWIPR